MKRHFIQYNPEWRPSPMRYWVHQPADGLPPYRASSFEPSLPRPVPGKGYPYFHVEVDDFTFEFASLDELDTCVEILSQKHLPSTDKETTAAKTGPGSHWLNKLPGHVRPWRYRSKAIKYLKEARKAFEREMAAR